MRSGPLPLEGAGGELRADHRGSNLGSSNFARGHAEGCLTSSASSTISAVTGAVSGKGSGKKKNVFTAKKIPERNCGHIADQKSSEAKEWAVGSDVRIGSNIRMGEFFAVQTGNVSLCWLQ